MGLKDAIKHVFIWTFLKKNNLDFVFYDVEKEEAAALELRSLYTTGKLNFPTILIKDKKLRNPRISDLKKWLIKKGFETLQK